MGILIAIDPALARDRSFENQRERACGLKLAVAVITWNTVYLERAVASLTEQKTEIQPELLAHLSPLSRNWEFHRIENKPNRSTSNSLLLAGSTTSSWRG